MNLKALADFMAKAGLRKVGVAVYMFSVVSYLLFLGPLPAPEYVQLVVMLILALYAGNALEHYVVNQKKNDDNRPS